MKNTLAVILLITLVSITGCSEAPTESTAGSQTESIEENNMDPSTDETEIVPTDYNSFSDAATYGDFDLVVKMITTNKEIVDSTDEYGFTALHNVMCSEELEIVQYLIDNGAKVNQQNEDGVAPLHIACYFENAKILLENGADIELKDNSGNTPLLLAAANGEESYGVAEFLIFKGASINATNNSGDTPLAISTSREDTNMMELFKNNQ